MSSSWSGAGNQGRSFHARGRARLSGRAEQLGWAAEEGVDFVISETAEVSAKDAAFLQAWNA
jgi:hypothetical protein